MKKGNRQKRSSGDSAKGRHAPRPPAVSQLRSGRRFLLWLVLILIPPILFFGLLEGGLRIAGYGHPTGFFIRIPDRSEFTANPDFGLRFFPPALVRTPQPCVLSAEKPAGTYRIFVLGGSAALGVPEPGFGFSRLLEAMLGETFPDTRFEVINAAMTAINSHVVLPIAGDCARMEPDLFVIYLGNNEVIGPFGTGTIFGAFSPHRDLIRAGLWVKTTRIGQLLSALITSLRPRPAPRRWGAMEMFLDNRVRADDPRMQDVYRHLHDNLSDICALAHRSGAQILLCTVGVNLKDNPPFASLHRQDLDPQSRQQWEERFAGGVERLSKARYGEAIAELHQAAQIDSHYAELHFHLARGMWNSGQYAAAREEFILANEWDALRFRADQGVNASIRQVAAEREGSGVFLVDAEAAFRRSPHTSHQVPGEELFYEHVHMNWAGTYLLAATVYQKILELLPPAILQQAGGDLTPPSSERCAELTVLTPWDRYQLHYQIYAMMDNPPFTNQIDYESHSAWRHERLREMEAELTGAVREQVRAAHAAAVEQKPEDLFFRQRLARLLQQAGNYAAAEQQWRTLIRRVPTHLEWQSELGIVLSQQGRSAEAIRVFRSVVRGKPRSPEYRNNLGRALARAGRTDDAIAEYRKAVELNPRFAEAHDNLGMSLARNGDLDGALQQYRLALEADPGLVSAHLNAAAVYEQQGKAEEALWHYQEATRVDPRSVAAAHNLGLALARGNHITEAIEQFRSALALAPGSSEAHFWLGALLAETGDAAAEAAEHLREAMRLSPDWVAPYHRLAHLLATHPDERIRDGQEAVRLAVRAAELSRYADPEILDTLAAAYAESGQFAEAVRAIERAQQLAADADNRQLLQLLAGRLQLYQSGKPLREEFLRGD